MKGKKSKERIRNPVLFSYEKGKVPQPNKTLLKVIEM